MVWLHGSGSTIGAGSLPSYDGETSASRDAVMVTINYRLSHLGFFAHPVLEEEVGERPYNFALLDQITTLQRVQENIHVFGGDATNVTPFGESAGACSVLLLMVPPKAKELSHKTIIQSGYTSPDLPRKKVLEKDRLLAGHFALPRANAEELRVIPTETFWSFIAPLNTGPTLIADDAILPQLMLEAFLVGCQHPIPVVISSNNDEASVIAVFGVDIVEQIQKLCRERCLGLGLTRLLYPGVKGDEALRREVCCDTAFTTLGYVAMQARQRTGQSRQCYWSDYAAETKHDTHLYGAWHGNEVPYVPSSLWSADLVYQYASEVDLAFATQAADYWTQFARAANGDQVPAGMVCWPACLHGRNRLLRIGLHKCVGFKVENRLMCVRLVLFRRAMKHHAMLE